VSLKQAAVSGVKWSAISQFGRQGAQLATTMVLARLLEPSDFGLVGMAMVMIGFVAMFKDLGTAAAVIQRKELTDQLLATVFWVNVVFGLVAMGGLILLAPLAATFYRETRVVPLLTMLATVFVISGLSIVHKALLERNLAFQKLARVEIIAVLSSSIVGIVAALWGYGAWSLVYQVLTFNVVMTVMLWVACDWKPALHFNWGEVKSVSAFSLNLVGFNIVNYFARNVDKLLIGRYLGAQNLGYYDLAYRILLFPLLNISQVLGRVMFPIFSRVQDQIATFRRSYLTLVSAIAMVSFPLMLGLMALSGPFVLTVFGEKWRPVILLLVILAPVGLMQSIGTTVGTIYQAKGRTDWMLRWGIGAGFLIVLALVIGLRWGIIGVAGAYATVMAILAYPLFAIPFKLIDLTVRDLGGTLWKTFLSSVIMFVIILVVKATLPAGLSTGYVLGVSVSTGIVVYYFSSWLVNRQLLQHLHSLIRGQPEVGQ